MTLPAKRRSRGLIRQHQRQLSSGRRITVNPGVRKTLPTRTRRSPQRTPTTTKTSTPTKLPTRAEKKPSWSYSEFRLLAARDPIVKGFIGWYNNHTEEVYQSLYIDYEQDRQRGMTHKEAMEDLKEGIKMGFAEESIMDWFGGGDHIRAVPSGDPTRIKDSTAKSVFQETTEGDVYTYFTDPWDGQLLQEDDMRISFKKPWVQVHTVDGIHYWDDITEDYPKGAVPEDVSQGLRLQDTSIPVIRLEFPNETVFITPQQFKKEALKALKSKNL